LYAAPEPAPVPCAATQRIDRRDPRAEVTYPQEGRLHAAAGEAATAIKLNSRAWVAPVMLAMFVIGLAWIVVFYVTDGSMPIDSLDNWNIVVGFGFIAAGFGVSTQWK
jgi:hypothetical protein